MPTPKQYRQHDHEERVRAQISGDGEVGVECGSAEGGLEGGEIGRLPAHERDEELAGVVAPGGEFCLVWRGVIGVSS